MAADPHHWKRMGHIPMLIILQIVFIVLFAKFVVYDEHSAVKNIHFDKNYRKSDVHATTEKTTDQDGNPAALTDEKEELHETTRDAKEILSDYPSKYIFIKYQCYGANDFVI